MAKNGPGRPKKESKMKSYLKGSQNVFTFPSIKPRHYQLKAWRDFHNGCRNFIISMPRRAGKDILSTSMAVDFALKNPNCSVVLMAPDKQWAKRIWWEKGQGLMCTDPISGVKRELSGSLLDICLPEVLRASTNKTEGKITLRNGSTITVMGTDEEKYVGMKFNFAVISETARHQPKVFGTISPVLMESGGVTIYNGTVEDEINHFWKMVQEKKDDPAWSVTYLTASQTKQYYWVSPDGEFNINPELQGKLHPETGKPYENIDSRRGVDDLSYLIREYLNVPTSVEKGSYYAELIGFAKQEDRVGPAYGYNSNFPVYCALDIGISDHTSIVWYQWIDNKLIFIDYYEENQQDMSHFIEVIRSKGYNTKAAFAPHDASKRSLQTGLNLIEYCQRQYGFNFSYVPKTNSIVSDIQVVRGYFPQMQFATPNCNELIAQLNRYREKVSTRKPDHGPESHAADAFRYAVMTIHKNLLKSVEYTSIDANTTMTKLRENVDDPKPWKEAYEDDQILNQIMGDDDGATIYL